MWLYIVEWILCTLCCSVVGLGLGFDSVSGWLVLMLLSVVIVTLPFGSHLSDSFQQANGEYGAETSHIRNRRRHNRQHCCPRHSEQHHQLSAELLSEHSANDLHRGVAVVERTEDQALRPRVPVERSVELKHNITLRYFAATIRYTWVG